MEFLKGILDFYKSTREVRALQLKITSLNRGIFEPNLGPWVRLVSGRSKEQEVALEDYFSLCQKNPLNQKVMADYRIGRGEMKTIYLDLMNAGQGQWVKGHYMALSALIYPETLTFILETKKRGWTLQEVESKLRSYFENKVPNGGLLRMLQDDGSKGIARQA